MEPLTIATILPAASGALFLTQAVYYMGLYSKIHAHNKETGTSRLSSDYPPLSVIIVAKDATDELQKNLPFILEQDYPEFEVIVIYDRSADDCDDALKLLEDKYHNLYHTFIPDSARYISHKKLGITMGIKASRHEWLVFTESNCRPQSNQWLRQMARNFTPTTEIVLGYSNYEKASGWFNKKITFDTLLNAMRYLGMAISGRPYMGTGRNLAYRKSLYYKQKGFTSHLNLQRGEDDLFINETSNRQNTRVETSPESIMRISTPKYKRIWCEEKISYMATSHFFKGSARYLMGWETCSRLLFHITIIATIVIGIWLHQWIMAGIALLLWILRFVMQLLVFRKASKDLGERKFYALLPVFDVLQPMWNFNFKLQRMMRRKAEFLRK
ncbi:glycosyltransferase [Phocaeicola sp.]